jgi:hypothetical protein
VDQLNISTSERITTLANQEWRFGGLAKDIFISGMEADFGGNLVLNATMVSIAHSNFVLSGSATQWVSGFSELRYLNSTLYKTPNGNNNAFLWAGQPNAFIDVVDMNVEFFSLFSLAMFRVNPTTQRVSFRNSELNVRVLWDRSDECPLSVAIEDSVVNSDIGSGGFLECSMQDGNTQAIIRSRISNINPLAPNCTSLRTYPTSGQIQNLYWSDVHFYNFGMGFTFRPISLFAENIFIECPNDLLLTPWAIDVDTFANTSITLRNITSPGVGYGAPIQITGPSHTSYEMVTLTLADLDDFFESHPCAFTLSGRFNFPFPTTLPTLCISAYQTVVTFGPSIEITRRVASLDPQYNAVWRAQNDQTILHPIALDGIDATINQLVYVPFDPEESIVGTNGSSLLLTSISIDWRQSYDPPVGITFILSDVVLSYSSFEGALTPDVFNLSHSLTGPDFTFEFLPVPCNSSCVAENMDPNPICANKLRCPCLFPWGGPFCGCNTTGIPEGSYCSESGQQTWETTNSFSLPSGQVLVIPDNYTFVVNGNTTISGELVLSEGTSLISSGVMVSEGVLTILCKLRERHVSATACSVYTTVSVISESFVFTGLNHVDLLLDVSELSTDGSCVQPSDISIFDDPTFKSLTTTIFQGENISWKVTFVSGTGSKRAVLEEQDVAKLKFNTSLVLSNDTSKSLGVVSELLVSTPSSDTCASFTSAPGQLSLFVAGCTPTPNPEGKAKSSIKWWWYGIPIIAVVVIAAIILTLVFTVGAAKSVVMPYRGSDGRL